MRKRRWLLITMAAAMPFLSAALVAAANAQARDAAAMPVSPEIVKWGFMAAAVVAGLAAVGAAYAVAVVGAAAMGAVAEKPEMAGRALIFVGLAEGIAIYGLIIAIMILGRLP
jgi:V/A-type H+-transporting ATPase subunit K